MASFIPPNYREGLGALLRKLSLVSRIALVANLSLTGKLKKDLLHTRRIPAEHIPYLEVSNLYGVIAAATR